MMLDRRINRGAAVAVTLALFAAGCGEEATSGGGGGSEGGGEREELKVGLSSALSGPIAYYGQDARRGMDLALPEVEKEFPNLDVTIVAADDQCSPGGGATAYRQLIDVEQVDVVLGSTCSGATLGGMPVLQSSQVPGMTFASTNPQISKDSGVGGNDFSWRMNVDDTLMGEQFSQLIAERDAKRIAILAANNDFGRGAAELYQDLLPDAGVEIASTEYFELGGNDMRAQLTKIDGAGVDGLLVIAEAPDCVILLRQMAELGMKQQVFSRGACGTQDALDELAKTDNARLADGLLEATYWTATPDQQDFVDAYREEYDAAAPYNAALAYYALKVAARAADAGGADPEGIQEGLASLDWDSPIGPIAFDDHHQAHPNMFVLTVEDGELELLDQLPTG